MKRVVALIFGLVVAVSSEGAPVAEVAIPPLVEHAMRRSYPLAGSELSELRDEFRRRHRSADVDGGDGHTRSRIEVQYEFEQGSQSCRLVEAQVLLWITTTLPEWKPRRTVSRELVQRWQALFTALVRHEATHADHARTAAGKLREELAALAEPMTSCDDIQRIARHRFDRVISKLRRRDRSFDIETLNGALDGVAL